MFRRKIGLGSEAEGDGELVQALLGAMHEGEADFTLAFRRLADAAEGRDEGFVSTFKDPAKATDWLGRWRERLGAEDLGDAARAAAMRIVNPAIIPRNHRIQEAIAAANYGDLSFFERLLQALEKPFDERPEFADYMLPPKPEERETQTFCGT